MKGYMSKREFQERGLEVGPNGILLDSSGNEYRDENGQMAQLNPYRPIELEVEIAEDGIYIYEKGSRQNEFVCWVEDEWKEDPGIVPMIAEYITDVYTNPKRLLEKLGKDANNGVIIF